MVTSPFTLGFVAFLNMATDEEVIRKRLLIEGESGGDDRRIGSLLKLFVKWSNTDETPEESAATYEKMVSMLAQIEFSMEKKLLIHNMNEKEMKNYEIIYQKIEKEISEAHERIAACKEELNEARRVRKHRQEYDNLARVIQKQPDRKETTKKLEELDKELGVLTESKNTLERKLEDRRKQFHVLINSIHELQRILEEDENKDALEISIDPYVDAAMDVTSADG